MTFKWFLWDLVVAQTVDTNADSSCSRTMELNMAFGSSFGPDIIMALVAAQATKISMTLEH